MTKASSVGEYKTQVISFYISLGNAEDVDFIWVTLSLNEWISAKFLLLNSRIIHCLCMNLALLFYFLFLFCFFFDLFLDLLFFLPSSFLIFIILLKLLCKFSKSLKPLKTHTRSILLNKNRFSLAFQYPHQLLYLSNRILFWFILVHTWQIVKNRLHINHLLGHYRIYLLLSPRTVTPTSIQMYLTISQGEFLPTSSNA